MSTLGDHYVVFSAEHARRLFPGPREPLHAACDEMLAACGSPVLVTLTGEGKRRKYEVSVVKNADDAYCLRAQVEEGS